MSSRADSVFALFVFLNLLECPNYTRKGWPDICLIKNGKFCGIEVKSEVERLSPEQEELGRDIILNGGMHVVARSLDDVQYAGLWNCFSQGTSVRFHRFLLGSYERGWEHEKT